jgi:hypothetical protein
MSLITQLKDADQDHEFYPTTNEIIRALIRNIKDGRYSGHYHQPTSMLDIGAGNGKVLEAVRDAEIGVHTLYAIERSAILRERLHHDVFVIGTDFHQQSLLSKSVGLIFCNPPYSEFEAWAVKIIRECAAPTAYLVIPQRWERSIPIHDSLTLRRTSAEIIGTFDFENAEDRAARAKVHLLKIDFRHRDDAFECFFREQFGDLIQKFEQSAESEEQNGEAPHGGRRRPFYGLVAGPDYPERMVELYHLEMANIQRNYQLVSELDADLLREFEVTPVRIMTLLRQRLTNLRTEYWHELFGRMKPITERLTSRTRKALLDTLNCNASVDFTVSNIHAVIVWAIKNANRYIEDQLIETYELMVSKANVVLYKSNQRVFVEERWRYKDTDSQNSHFALDYRIVTHRVGGIQTSSYSWENRMGLSQRAHEFLGDLITIANNLGFLSSPDVANLNGSGDRWVSNKPRSFFYRTPEGKIEILFEARAFQNGNIHLRLAKKFALALNVEFGRLKGWLRNAGEAATELNDLQAAAFFNSTLRLGGGNNALLLQ